MRPELLAVRAINQYRRRDVLAYLGLRYYFENYCTLTDKWAQDVSTHLASTRKTPAYFRSYHFKEMDGDSVIHRNICVPGPNEVLAETALLYECSKYEAFKSSQNVYSYHFPDLSSKEGVFKTYFPGFKGRHQSISDTCKNLNDSVVRYADIRKFYPNISRELAVREWGSACDSANIPVVYRELGENILTEHNKTALAIKEGSGVLIGPMFSHLMANLILANVDKTMSEKTGGKYWRYVDDIVLVGDTNQVNDDREYLSSILRDMGFTLHEDGKDFEVDSATWLEGAKDFNGSEGKVWISLIANIKRFLVAKPSEREILERAFLENQINIPLLDYSNIVSESTYVEKLLDWLAQYSWSRGTVRVLTVQKLVNDAIQARNFYDNQIHTLLATSHGITGYERKRLIPKLRFYSGRLIYLGTPDMISSVSSCLVDYPELFLQSNVLNAIQTSDISPLLRLGSNAVQAASQILRLRDEPVKCSLVSFGEVELQGVAILRLNGINIDFSNNVIGDTTADLLNQFAIGNNPVDLMKTDDPFIKEIACLRGTENSLRHAMMLDTAFDRDEQLIFDVINQLHQSSYF